MPAGHQPAQSGPALPKVGRRRKRPLVVRRSGGEVRWPFVAERQSDECPANPTRTAPQPPATSRKPAESGPAGLFPQTRRAQRRGARRVAFVAEPTPGRSARQTSNHAASNRPRPARCQGSRGLMSGWYGRSRPGGCFMACESVTVEERRPRTAPASRTCHLRPSLTSSAPFDKM